VITRSTLVKAGVFVVLSLVLIFYVGAHFLGLFNFLGPRGYTVQVPVADASGLFTRGEVTYRGVKVGLIGPLRLTENGVMVELNMDGGGPPIPADLNAVVADRSAVGERYVDLRPNTDHGPFLRDGDVIAADRVSIPEPVDGVLKNLDQLVASVPLDDLRTTVSELGKAFNGLGPRLQLLLDSTHSLTVTATENLPQTLALIHDARTVLQTQNDLSDPIKRFSRDVKLVSEQLKESDPDIRRLLRTGPEASREISDLIEEAGDPLHRFIREALTTSQILRGRLRPIQSVLQLYPMLAAAIPTLIPGDGTAHLGLVLNLNDPPNCTRGYEATVRRPGTNVRTDWPINYRAYCREPIYSPINVRGVKPQYPFVNGHPGRPPEWFFAFYQDGPAAGIFGPPSNRRDGDHRGGHGSRAEADPSLAFYGGTHPPGLLGAPASFGQFGLTPSVLGQ
jgi:phospholipid/cholesterol/gamma-HCH transport system substrate-binding protein